MSVLETAQKLVSLPSVNPGYDPASRGEADVVDWLLAWAAGHNLESSTQEVFPGRRNVILTIRNGEGLHLLLNGHTDTVAVSEMTIPSFDAEVRDDRLWGRGAADMKGPLACMMHALLELRNNPSSWQGTVTLACVVDEELGFAGIRHYLASEPALDFAIVGEPTRFDVVRGCKGCLRFAMRAHGKAAHSSMPEKGISAITAMAGAVTAMDHYFATQLCEIAHPSLGISTGSVGTIRGGSGINIVPDWCEAQVDIRLVPGQSWSETYSAIQQAVGDRFGGIRWDFDPKPMVDLPYCLEKDHPLVLGACGAVGKADSQVVNFSCDASKIAAAGIPCLIFGPGDIAQAHTADESISLEDLPRGVEAYMRIAENLLGKDSLNS